jgi:hypothetical protein
MLYKIQVYIKKIISKILILARLVKLCAQKVFQHSITLIQLVKINPSQLPLQFEYHIGM